MDELFINKLLLKPASYLQVACYLYAKRDKKTNSVEFSYLELITKFKIPKPTLSRIINTICEWNASGTQVERKWNGNNMIINIFGMVSGTQVERKWNASGTVRAENTQPNKDINNVMMKWHKIQDFIDKRLKNVKEIEQQLTYDDCCRLVGDLSDPTDLGSPFKTALVKSKLLKLENIKNVSDRYNSVYYTLLDWCQNELAGKTYAKTK